MNYLKNHCWCSNSHWDNEMYDCKIIVSLSSYKEYDKEDWNNLMTTKEFFCQKTYEEFSEDTHPFTEAQKKRFATKEINIPKPEVIQWLEENVPMKNGKHMWCIGSDEYIFGDSSISFSFFFQEYRSAMKFIKQFSKWKKPVHYTQYFTDIRKTLNLETGKYQC